jgi:hypothetical protein
VLERERRRGAFEREVVHESFGAIVARGVEQQRFAGRTGFPWFRWFLSFLGFRFHGFQRCHAFQRCDGFQPCHRFQRCDGFHTCHGFGCRAIGCCRCGWRAVGGLFACRRDLLRRGL